MPEKKTLSLYSPQLLSDMLIFTEQFTAKATQGVQQSKTQILLSEGFKPKSNKKPLKNISSKTICKAIEMFTYA